MAIAAVAAGTIEVDGEIGYFPIVDGERWESIEMGPEGLRKVLGDAEYYANKEFWDDAFDEAYWQAARKMPDRHRLVVIRRDGESAVFTWTVERRLQMGRGYDTPDQAATAAIESARPPVSSAPR